VFDRTTLWTAIFAKAFEDDAFADDLEIFANVFRDVQIIIGPVLKVDDFTALGAMQMMMVCHIGVEPLGAAEYFDHIHHADFREG
jgi:hypothetical protein